MSIRRLLSAVLVLGSLCLLPGYARAETYNTCAGFIESLPATISTQGVWCLRKDLATSMASGNAINIATNNVTIDCNDFKIGGLAAGNASQTTGIYASNRQNVAVRRCVLRGFRYGIALSGGAGHLVEDNRLDNNLYMGIFVDPAESSLVQRNRVFDTGGFPGNNSAYGIAASADVIDNTISGVFATATNTFPYGISVAGSGNEVRGNRVRGLVVAGSGNTMGILVGSSGIKIADNHVSAASLTAGAGISGGGPDTFCTGNTVINFSTAYNSCEHNSDNLPAP